MAYTSILASHIIRSKQECLSEMVLDLEAKTSQEASFTVALHCNNIRTPPCWGPTKRTPAPFTPIQAEDTATFTFYYCFAT